MIYSNISIFVHLFLIENYEQGALRKELITPPFAGRPKTATLRKFYWQISFVLRTSWIKPFIFPHFLLIEGYGRYALCKEPVSATFVGRFKIATLRKPYWYISSSLRAICLAISFSWLVADRKRSAVLYERISALQNDQCSTKEAVTAPFIERVKIATMRECCWQLPLVLRAICLIISFLLTFCW